MAHYDECVESQGSVQHNLARALAHDGGQPSALARVHEQEDGIVLGDKLLQLLKVLLCLGLVGNRMAQHGHLHGMALRIDARVNLPQRLGGALGFLCAALEAVIKGEERLAHGVGEGDFGVVDKGDFAHAPAHQYPRDVGAQGAGAEQQAFAVLDDIEVDVGRDAPLDELEVQVDGLVGQLALVHVLGQVDVARRQLAGLGALPARDLGELGRRAVSSSSRRDVVGLEVEDQGVGLVAPQVDVAVAEDLDVAQLPAVADEDEQVAQRPAGVVFVCRRVGEADEAVLGVDVVEEALFVLAQLADHPRMPYVFHGRDWRLGCVVRLGAPAKTLCEEEASLAHIAAVLERLHSVDEVCRLSRGQPACRAELLPRRVGLDGGEAKVVGELVLFEVGEDDGGEGGEE